jgi:hypothetical protein
MIETIPTIIPTLSSFLLFVYWFRYACFLILAAKTTRDYSGAVAAANQLDFPNVRSKLPDPNADLDRLKDALDRDYEILLYLLKKGAHPPTGEAAIEKRMLEIYFGLMRGSYRATSHFWPATACRALGEMSIVLTHFANAIGERVEVPP